MAVFAATVAMRFAQFDADQIQLPVPYPALRDDLLGEFAHLLHRSFQHDGLNALIVIEVGVHARYGQIMMRVLYGRQPLAQLALVVVIDVG